MKVQIIKKTGEDETVIYTGRLGDYENGMWSHTDFSDTKFLVAFDCKYSEDEAVYIVPIHENNSDASVGSTANTFDLLSVDVDSSDIKYSIKQAIIKNSDNVIVHDCPSNGQLESLTLIKNTVETVPVKVFAALYNNSNMETMKIVDVTGTQSLGEEIVCDVNLLFGEITENHYVKIMVWEGTNSLRPLVEPYDTSIVTINYVYSNTIQSLEQEDKYIFTVPSDGYYNIEFNDNTSIIASVYIDNTEDDNIATSISGQEISCPLSSDEIYVLKVISTEIGAYSFSIKQIPIPQSNNLSIGITANGQIYSAYGLEQFTFVPSTSATYDFYVNSEEIYPIINIVDGSGTEIGYEDNLTYKQDVFLTVEMNANEKYIITIKSRKDFYGGFSVTPRMVNATINSNGNVSVVGKLNNNAGKKIGMIVIDPNGSVGYLTQTISNADGQFSTNIKIDTEITGTYFIIVNSEDLEYGVVYKLDNGGSIKDRSYDFWTETNTYGLSATILYSSSVLSSSETITAAAEITNTSSESKTVTVHSLLLDNDENIIEFSSSTYVVGENETTSVEKQKTMPESISGYKWRTFVWLGNGNYNSSLRPICAYKEINENGITTNSVSVNYEDINNFDESDANLTKEYILNGQTKTLKFDEILNVINMNEKIVLSETDEEYSGAGVEYSYKIKHNGVYYSSIMPGTNEIEFFFKNTNSEEVSFVPFVWLISTNDGVITEKYLHCGRYITLVPGEGTTTPWVHSMVLEDDYNLDLVYGDIVDFLLYTDIKGIIRFIPYTDMVTPIVFNKSSSSKFIYCNNPEALDETKLSDNPTTPQLLLSEKSAGVGNYSLMAEHNNQIESEVYLDVQFFSGNYAKIKINALGVQRPDGGESWACAEAYSDYMQLNFARNSGYSVSYFDENVAEFELNSGNSSVWLSDIYEAIYNKSYPTLPAKNGGYYRCVYIIMDFEIISGAADINVAAYKNRTNHSAYCDEGTYYWDKKHKGISDDAPFVYTNMIISFSDAIPDGTEIPVRVFNSYNPYGYQTNTWLTNLNPQSDIWNYDKCAESDMLGFVYNDGKKSLYYGDSVDESQKDDNWYFDTLHGDNKMQVVSKTWNETDSGGYWQYTTNSQIPDEHIPNDILTLSPYQSETDITSFDLACSLGNYSVQTVYYLVLINLSENTRRFEYWLDTNSNNMIYVYHDNSGFVDYFAKGENKGDQRMAYIDVPSASVEYMTIMEVLPTGNVGGMKNRFVITSAN